MAQGGVKMPVFSVCVVVFFAGLSWGAEPVGPELLPNGGFEEPGRADEVAAGWAGFFTRDWGDCAGVATRSEHEPFEGRYCAEISDVRETYAVLRPDRIPVEPDKAYLLRGWVRTALARGEAAYLVASWSSEERWLALERSREITGRQPWQEVSLVLRPEARPAEASHVQVSFRVSSGTGRGRAWVDAMSLREAVLPPPPPAEELETRRLLDMTRELLIEREVWRERLRVLQQRRADLEALLREEGDFAALVARHGEAARERRFLTRLPRPREEFERTAPTAEADLRAQAESLRELPTLREQCFRELEGMVQLKRRLDERPDLRRFFLWAQVEALRPPAGGAATPDEAAAPGPAFLAAMSGPPDDLSGELWGLEVRTSLDLPTDTGTVTLRLTWEPQGPGERLEAGLWREGEGVAAFASADLRAGENLMQLSVPSPHYWFPDAPHLYRLGVAVVREGQVADWSEQQIGFRDIRIVESDVTATGRHAWRWAPADYTFVINGQPYFPRGTVGHQATQLLDEGTALFGELWLDFQRTYGTALPRIAGERGDRFAQHGIGYLAALAGDYRGIRRYVSAEEGLEDYREAAAGVRGLVTQPWVLVVETGNEAELSVWGADLPSVYGKDLWHVFNEVTRALREEAQPDTPVSYVRAAHFGSVLPVPREDYSGVNEYTGRYWGRRATIAGNLEELSRNAAFEHKPIGITEWFGPKYSWATRGVSGVDEEGAAQYLHEYYENLTRTPGLVLSTQFVLNWVVTPVEDFSSVSLEEGMARHRQWQWSLQQGTPWYPAIWPDLLTDTPARRAMGGLQSPLFELIECPGEMVVAAAEGNADAARGLAAALEGMGREARVTALPTPEEFARTPANYLLLGGHGEGQPPVVRELERMRVVGATTPHFPRAGGFLIQRRVNPHFPDRFLVVVTAADAAGMEAALEKLRGAAGGLQESLERRASARRMLALIDEDRETAQVFARYVLELPTRAGFQGRDDLRVRLDPGELLDADGNLRPEWSDLGAVVVAARREFHDDEARLLRALPDHGVNVIWSSASLAANADLAGELGVSLGEAQPVTESLPVADWAQGPLAVPEMGDVAADRVQTFGRIEPGDDTWERVMTIRALQADEPWRAAATTADGRPVVVMRQQGEGSHWAFGSDLAQVAVNLWRITHRGVNHQIYDRDTACGLERTFRLVANAAAGGHAARPADTPRLRAAITLDREWYAPGDTLTARVAVRDAEGNPQDGTVRVAFMHRGWLEGDQGRSLHLPVWLHATQEAPGLYEVVLPVPAEAGQEGGVHAQTAASRLRAQRYLTVWAEVTRPGWVGDWTARSVRVGDETDEHERMKELARLVHEDLLQARLSVREEQVEVEAAVTIPREAPVGEPFRLDVTVSQIEHDTGDDWMQDVYLVFICEDSGVEVALPLAPGRYLGSPRASVVRSEPERTTVVMSSSPAVLPVVWEQPTPGNWSLWLRYRYTDDYHLPRVDRVPRQDRFGSFNLRVR